MTTTYTCDNVFGFKEELYDNISAMIGQDQKFLDLTICDTQGHSVIIVEKIGKLFIQERESIGLKQILIKTLKGMIVIWKNKSNTYVIVKYPNGDMYPTQITFRYR